MQRETEKKKISSRALSWQHVSLRHTKDTQLIQSAERLSNMVTQLHDKLYLSLFKNIPQGRLQRVAHGDSRKETALLVAGNPYRFRACCAAQHLLWLTPVSKASA